MYNHAPADYINPFQKLVEGVPYKGLYSKPEDIFYQDEHLTAFVAGVWWPNNPGSVMIIPNQPIENLYDMPDELLGAVAILSRRIAIAMKEVYQCDGVSVRQHNEPAGNQEVWHYHYQVIPRYNDDQLYQRHDEKALVDRTEIVRHAELLRNYFNQLSS